MNVNDLGPASQNGKPKRQGFGEMAVYEAPVMSILSYRHAEIKAGLTKLAITQYRIFYRYLLSTTGPGGRRGNMSIQCPD